MRSLVSAAVVLAAAAGLVVAGAPAASAAPQKAADESEYTPVAPVRVLDTRTGAAAAPVGPGRTISLDLAGHVPAGTTAVVLNVTGVAPTAATYVTAFPTGEARPLASNLNLARAETRANLVTVRVTAERAVSLYNYVGSTHLVADLAGYYSTGDASLFTPSAATRVLTASVGPGTTTVVDLSPYVPESATAVALNVTGTRPTADTYLTAWPAGTTRPVVSNVNLTAGSTNPNLVTVALGAGRKVSVFNAAGTVSVLVDLSGFYTPEFGGVFAPRTPARVFDTRTGAGSDTGTPRQLGARDSAALHPGAAIPDTATGAVLNLTGINPTAGTYLTAGPEAYQTPTTSNLNLVAGQTAANLAVVPTRWQNPDARLYFYNAGGRVDLAADLAGYFWVPPTECANGCAYTWGSDFGRLGQGTTTTYGTPGQVTGLSDVTAVADRYALRADGTVWAWGYGGTHDLGVGWLSGWQPTPLRVSGLTDVVAIAAAWDAGLALRADGTVWAWGSSVSGVVGDLDAHSPVPVRIPGLTGVTDLAAGWSTAYALRADGTVWAWGDNAEGQLGRGTTASSRVPVRVSGLTGVTAIGAGEANGFAVLADGTVRSWGTNGYGQLGNGSDVPVSWVPVPVVGLTDVTAVTADHGHAFALRTDGTVWAWGDTYGGALGDGVDCDPLTDCARRHPAPVADLPPVTDVAASGGGGYALDQDGRVWAWGTNGNGELGHADTNDIATRPVLVPGLPTIDSLEPTRMGGRALAAEQERTHA